MKHLCVVLTEPTDGKAAELGDYYENVHLDEVLATTGWETAQRFRLTDQIGQKCPLLFVAPYGETFHLPYKTRLRHGLVSCVPPCFVDELTALVLATPVC